MKADSKAGLESGMFKSKPSGLERMSIGPEYSRGFISVVKAWAFRPPALCGTSLRRFSGVPDKGEHHRREDYAGNGEGLFSVVLEMDCKINVLTIKTHGQSQLEHGFSVYLHVYYTCGILNPNSDGTYGKKKRYTGKFLLFSANILSKILSIK